MAPRPRLLLGQQPLHSGTAPASSYSRSPAPPLPPPPASGTTPRPSGTRPHFPKAAIGGLGGQRAGHKARIDGLREDERKEAGPRQAIGGASGKGRCRCSRAKKRIWSGVGGPSRDSTLGSSGLGGGDMDAKKRVRTG